ncbi:hypothetical protein BESB_044440 [Besnoitia besnoiti]|uniref:Cilia- and flagella-associated protein 206 n=1 Tax=Besnoitia besnoiti TaxID=94643 RepID=A0A2A9MLC8_BESBE|nr:hypothetical protein BESB_044440 [Besnoitia besnoiti]PFH36252.1 hypothetical protein BESB_044440 [Besnoitia besnoiti]
MASQQPSARARRSSGDIMQSAQSQKQNTDDGGNPNEGSKRASETAGPSQRQRKIAGGAAREPKSPGGSPSDSRRPSLVHRSSGLLTRKEDAAVRARQEVSFEDNKDASHSRRTSLQLKQRKEQTRERQRQSAKREKELPTLTRRGGEERRGADEAERPRTDSGNEEADAEYRAEAMSYVAGGSEERRDRDRQTGLGGEIDTGVSGREVTSGDTASAEKEETGRAPAREESRPSPTPDVDAVDKFEWELQPQEIPYHQQGNPKFDSPEVLEARQRLKNHPAIQCALAEIWKVFQKDKNDCISREEYTNVLMRICLVLRPTLPGESAISIIENDWRRDSRGSPALTFSLFRDAFFELADLWTPVLDGDAYAAFLTKLFKRITVLQVTRAGSAEKVRVIPRIAVRFRTRQARSLSAAPSPPSSTRTVVSLVRSPSDKPRMTAEWRAEDARQLREALEEGCAGPGELEFEEDVVAPLLPSTLPEAVKVETVWADKSEIAPLGAAAQALIDAVIRQAAADRAEDAQATDAAPETQREDVESEENVDADPTDSGNHAGNESEVEENKGGERDCPQKRGTVKRSSASSRASASLRRRSNSDPLVANSSGPLARRWRDGDDYGACCEGDRETAGGNGRSAATREEALPRRAEGQTTVPLGTSDEEQPREDAQDKAVTARGRGGVSVRWAPTSEVGAFRFDWPLRNSSYFHSPASVQRPLDVAYARQKLRTEAAKVRCAHPPPALSLTVSLAAVPKVVTLDGTASLSRNSSTAGAPFVIGAADNTLFETLEDAPEAPASDRAEARTKPRIRFRSQSLPLLCDDRGDNESCSWTLQGSTHFDSAGAVARRTAESLATRAAPLVSSSSPRSGEETLSRRSQTLCSEERLTAERDVPAPALSEEGDGAAYVHEVLPPFDDGPRLCERDVISLATTPKQAILVTGPSIPEKSRLAYKLARKLGLEWLQSEYLLESLSRLAEQILSPLAKRLLRQLQRGKAVSVSDSLRLASEFMSSRRGRAAGYVLELPSDDPRAVERFLKKTKEVSGKPVINWDEFLARQNLESLREEEEKAEGKEGGEEEEGEEDGIDSEEQSDEAGTDRSAAPAAADEVTAAEEPQQERFRKPPHKESEENRAGGADDAGQGRPRAEDEAVDERRDEEGAEEKEDGWEQAVQQTQRERDELSKDGERPSSGESLKLQPQQPQHSQAMDTQEPDVPEARPKTEATSEKKRLQKHQNENNARAQRQPAGDAAIADRQPAAERQDSARVQHESAKAPTDAEEAPASPPTPNEHDQAPAEPEEQTGEDNEASATEDAEADAGPEALSPSGNDSGDSQAGTEEALEPDASPTEAPEAATASENMQHAEANEDTADLPSRGATTEAQRGQEERPAESRDEGEAETEESVDAGKEGGADGALQVNAAQMDVAARFRDSNDRAPEVDDAHDGTGAEVAVIEGDAEGDGDAPDGEAEDGEEEEEINEKQEARDALEKALKGGKIRNPLMDVYPREVVLVQVEAEDIDVLAKTVGVDAEKGGAVRVLDPSARPFRQPHISTATSTDSLSTVNKSFLEEPHMNLEDLDVAEDVLTAMRRLFPPPFAYPPNPPLRSARSQPAGLGEDGRLFFRACTAADLREQRQLANEIVVDLFKSGVRALRLCHGDTTTSGMARILTTQIHKSPSAVSSVPPFLQFATPLPAVIQGVEPFTPLADLLTLGLSEARDRERREEEEENVEERQAGEATDDEDEATDDSPPNLERGATLPSRASTAAELLEAGGPESRSLSQASLDEAAAGGEASRPPFSRLWSPWKQVCPVSFLEEGVAAPGQRELAVDYGGRVFLFRDQEKQRRFLDDPRMFVSREPVLNTTSLSVALCGLDREGARKQAALLADAYGIAQVDVHDELRMESAREEAWQRARAAYQTRFEAREAAREKRRAEWTARLADYQKRRAEREVRRAQREEQKRAKLQRGEGAEARAWGTRDGFEECDKRDRSDTEEEEEDKPPEEELEEDEVDEPPQPDPCLFRLTDEERNALKEGKALGEDTIARAVAFRLGLGCNVEIRKARLEEEGSLKARIEKHQEIAQDGEGDTELPNDLPIDPQTLELQLPPLALSPPASGFVVIHLACSQAQVDALARLGIHVRHWLRFTVDVPEEERETHARLQELQTEADAAAKAIAAYQRRHPAACPNSSLSQPRTSRDFYDLLGGSLPSTSLESAPAELPSARETGDLTSRSMAFASSAAAEMESARGGRAERSEAPNQRAAADADGAATADNTQRARELRQRAETLLAVKEQALLKQEEDKLFFETEKEKPESDLDVPIVRVYLHLSDMAKHYRIRQAIDPFFVAPDEPDSVPPLPDISSVLALVDECSSLRQAPEGRRKAPYAPAFPFLPPLPSVFYGETGHYCPVSLRRQQWLLPGDPEFAVSVQQRIYLCRDASAKALFSLHPGEFIPSCYLARDAEEEAKQEASVARRSGFCLAGAGAAAAEDRSFHDALKKEVHVPPPRIAFLGPEGSRAWTHMARFNRAAGLPVLRFAAEFSQVFRDLLRRCKAREDAAQRRAARRHQQAEAQREPEGLDGHATPAAEATSDFLDLDSEAESEDEAADGAPQDSLAAFLAQARVAAPARDAASEAKEADARGAGGDRAQAEPDDIWRSWSALELSDETVKAVRMEAVKRVLHSAMGPALIDGRLFPALPPSPPEDDEADARLATTSFASLTRDAQRLPDAVIIFVAGDDSAASRTLDFEKIEREAMEAARRKLAAQEARRRWRAERERRREREGSDGEDDEEEEGDEDEDDEDETEEDQDRQEARIKKENEDDTLMEDKNPSQAEYADEEDEEDAEGDADATEGERANNGPLRIAARKAVKKAREEFLRQKKVQDTLILQSAKLFAAAMVPVLVIDADRTDVTIQRAISRFLLPFLHHRQSLLLAPQCLRLDRETCTRYLKSGVARHSRFGVFSPNDVDAPVSPASLRNPVLLNGRVFYPGATSARVDQFCRFPSLFLASPPPAPRLCLPRVCVLGPPLAGKSTGSLCLPVLSDSGGAPAPAPLRRPAAGLCLGWLPGAPWALQAPAAACDREPHRGAVSPLAQRESSPSLAVVFAFPVAAAASQGPRGEGAEAERRRSSRRERRRERRTSGGRGGEGPPGVDAGEAKSRGDFRRLPGTSFKALLEKQSLAEGTAKTSRRGGGTEAHKARQRESEARMWMRPRSTDDDSNEGNETARRLDAAASRRLHTAGDLDRSSASARPEEAPSGSRSDTRSAVSRQEGESPRAAGGREREQAREGLPAHPSDAEEERERTESYRAPDGAPDEEESNAEDRDAEEDEEEELGGSADDRHSERGGHDKELHEGGRECEAADSSARGVSIEEHPDELQQSIREAPKAAAGEVKEPGRVETLAARIAKNMQRKERDEKSLADDAELNDADDEECAFDIIFIFHGDEALTDRRSADIQRRIQPDFPVHDERDCQANPDGLKESLSSFRVSIAPLKAYYASVFNNIIPIPAEASAWRQFEIARQEVESFCRRKHEYLRRKAEGKAARCFFIGRKQSQAIKLVTKAFKTYCPVCWGLQGALYDSGGNPFHQAEFRGGVYFCCSEEHLQAFLKTPSAYIRDAVPKDLPVRLSLAELQSFSAPPPFQFKGLCPVACVERQTFADGNFDFVAKYAGEYWTFSSAEALESFLHFPSAYVERARSVPPALLEAEALKGRRLPRTLQQLAQEGEAQIPPQPALLSLAVELKDAFTFLEVTTSELLMEALTQAGLKRLVFPGQSIRQSALRFLALYLHAHNALMPPVMHRDALKTLSDFISGIQFHGAPRRQGTAIPWFTYERGHIHA